MSMRTVRAALMACIAASSVGCATSAALVDAEAARTNTQTVLAFEETVYNRHRIAEGFERYVAPEFRQHSSALPEDRDGTIRALTQLLTGDYPASRVVVERTVAQGDLVAAQLLWNPHPGDARGIARVDIYRLRDGRIVERWEVTQSAGERPLND